MMMMSSAYFVDIVRLDRFVEGSVEVIQKGHDLFKGQNNNLTLANVCSNNELTYGEMLTHQKYSDFTTDPVSNLK